jgi:hypothetical protein
MFLSREAKEAQQQHRDGRVKNSCVLSRDAEEAQQQHGDGRVKKACSCRPPPHPSVCSVPDRFVTMVDQLRAKAKEDGSEDPLVLFSGYAFNVRPSPTHIDLHPPPPASPTLSAAVPDEHDHEGQADGARLERLARGRGVHGQPRLWCVQP